LDDSGCAYTWLVNPSGGLVGGDHVSVEARLGAGAHVVMTTPSATRVYRSLSAPAIQRISLEVGSGAILEWLPESTIPYAGSRFIQYIQVVLAPRATLLLWDGMASGRVASGERWAFASYDNEICIGDASEGAIIERSHIRQDSVGTFVCDWDYVGSLFLVSDRISGSRSAMLRDMLAEALDSVGSEVVGGVTEAPVCGVAVKLVARSAPVLAQVQQVLWDLMRREFLGFSPTPLRRY
jgi:urease accessory protein